MSWRQGGKATLVLTIALVAASASAASTLAGGSGVAAERLDPRTHDGSTDAARHSLVDALDEAAEPLRKAVVSATRAPECSVTVDPPGLPRRSVECPTGSGDDQDDGDDGDSSSSDPIRLEPEHEIETPRWYASTATADGHGQGAHVRVHGFGEVALVDGTGEIVWRRPSMSFYDDWDLQPTVVPFVLLGAAPANPLTRASEHAYDLGDLTGDGVDDVVVSHYVTRQEDPVPASEVSAVTVLDGTDGGTVATRVFEGTVPQVLASGDRVVAASDRSGRLVGLELEATGNGSALATAWTHEVGEQGIRWLSLTEIGGDHVAAAWSGKDLGDDGTAGHVLRVASDGSVDWRTTTEGYPRHLRHDPIRGELLVHEQADPVEPVLAGTAGDFVFDYTLRSLSTADGEQVQAVHREDKLLVSLHVTDAAGGSAWIAGDLNTTDVPVNRPPLFRSGFPEQIQAGRVVATDPATGEARWAHVVESPGLLFPYGLASSGDLVVVGAWEASAEGPAQRGPTHESLIGLTAEGGARAWTSIEAAPFPLFLATGIVQDRPAVLSSGPHLTGTAHAVADGSLLLEVPVLQDVHEVATHDVDDDGTRDVIAGTPAGWLFALDGEDLSRTPERHWTVDTRGAVHRVHLADLQHDGRPELVVVASDAVQVLDAGTGAERFSFDPGDRMAFSVTIGDVDRDGTEDLVVPGEAVRAVDGGDGELLWSYSGPSGVDAMFSPAAVTASGSVGVQFFLRHQPEPSFVAEDRHHVGVTALDGATGEPLWLDTHEGFGHVAHLWKSTAHHPDIAASNGDAFAVAWQEEPLRGPGRPRVDVYNATTGEHLWKTSTEESIVHMGLTHIRGLTEYNWAGTARATPEGPREAHLGATAELQSATLPGGRTVVVKTWSDVVAHDLSTLDQAPDEPPSALDAHRRLRLGDLEVTELDGTAGDEIVAHSFDWPAYARVLGWQGIGVFSYDILPHGLTVLDVEEASGS